MPDPIAPISAPPAASRVAHGSDGCQTDRLPDGSWPATCTCGSMTIVDRVEEAPGG